jgi:DNA polymerase III delta prime subunit
LLNATCVEPIQALMRRGLTHDAGWQQTSVLPFRSLSHVPHQTVSTCDTILEHIREQRYIGGVYLCSGRPGVGKTMTAKMLTMKLSGTVCLEFNPSKPANTLFSIISACPPTEKNPLILVIEEVDKVFDHFGNQQPDCHATFVTQVRDKDDWNNLLDYVCSIDNVVLLMTTNLTMPELTSKYDRALVRNFRVTRAFEFE